MFYGSEEALAFASSIYCLVIRPPNSAVPTFVPPHIHCRFILPQPSVSFQSRDGK